MKKPTDRQTKAIQIPGNKPRLDVYKRNTHISQIYRLKSLKLSKKNKSVINKPKMTFKVIKKRKEIQNKETEVSSDRVEVIGEDLNIVCLGGYYSIHNKYI
jgi:hypothetical protein